ncbi:hypothetical protein [Haloferax elongans]|nr:hypothetical protein [Haloferax elongans]
MTNRDNPHNELQEGIDATKRRDMAGKEDVVDGIKDGDPDILTLRVEQIDHMTIADVNLIQQLAEEDVPVESIPERTLEWLIELGVIAVGGDYARLKSDGVVFEPLVSPDEVILPKAYRCRPDSERYGGYDKEEELEGVELPPDREPRTPDDEN